MDVPDAGNGFHDILGHAFGCAVLDRAGEGHLAILDLNFDLRGVDVRVVGQALIDVLANALVGAAPVFGTGPG